MSLGSRSFRSFFPLSLHSFLVLLVALPAFCRSASLVGGAASPPPPSFSNNAAKTTPSSLILPGSLDWCEYWKSVGKARPECDGIKTTTTTAVPPAPVEPAPAVVPNSGQKTLPSIIDRQPGVMSRSLAMCPGPPYRQCGQEQLCASGTSCQLEESAIERCCLPVGPKIVAPRVHDACPRIEELNIKCAVLNPTSWCNSDFDCHNTPVKLCCPTGCGYNICVQSQGYVIDNGITEISNPHCPLMHLIEIKCEKASPTNWCNADRDCLAPHNPLERHCCPTVCQYNTCVTNYNGRYVIG